MLSCSTNAAGSLIYQPQNIESSGIAENKRDRPDGKQRAHKYSADLAVVILPCSNDAMFHIPTWMMTAALRDRVFSQMGRSVAVGWQNTERDFFSDVASVRFAIMHDGLVYSHGFLSDLMIANDILLSYVCREELVRCFAQQEKGQKATLKSLVDHFSFSWMSTAKQDMQWYVVGSLISSG